MANIIVDDDFKKKHITIVLPYWQIKRLREINGYNAIIQRLLDEYFYSLDNKKNV